MSNFNIRKFLTENKLTEQSKRLNEMEVTNSNIRKKILNAIESYMDGSFTRDELVKTLRKVERSVKTEFDAGNRESIWFRFYKNDTLATDIDDIERSLRSGSPNKETLIDDFNEAINNPNGFKVMLS